MENGATGQLSGEGKSRISASGQVWLKIAAAIAVLGALIAAWTLLPVADWIESFRDGIAARGVWGHVIFIAVYIIATIALAPVGLLTLAAGFAFGLWAFPSVIIGATAGLALSFLIGRHFARDWVAKRTANSRLFKAVDRAIESEGWKIVGLMRLSPLIPFNLQNYAFGLTSIGFWPYLMTSFIGIMPGTLLYVWIGSLGAAAGQAGRDTGTYETIALVVGLIATLIVTVIISRTAQSKLKEIGVDDSSDAV